MQTLVAPVRLRVGAAEPIAAEPFPFHFVVPSQDSTFVLEAEISPADLAAARARWRAATRAIALCVLAGTLLLCAGPMIDMRRRTVRTSRFITLTAALIVLVVAVRFVCYIALSPLAGSPEPTPVDLLLTTLTLAAVVWLVLDLIERRRAAKPRLPLLTQSPRALALAAAAYGGSAAAATWLMWGYEVLLRRVVADTNLDLLHFSLHPLSAARISIEFALVLLHAAVVWGAVALLRVPAARWRMPRTPAFRLAAAAGWLSGTLAGTALAHVIWARAAVPMMPLWAALAAAAGAAAVLARVGPQMRRLSQTARLAVFFARAARAVDRDVSVALRACDHREGAPRLRRVGPEAASLREDLQRRLQQAVEADRRDAGALGVRHRRERRVAVDRSARRSCGRAPISATYRLTSAVELYDAERPAGQPIRAEPAGVHRHREPRDAAARWEEPFEEVSPFGSSERHVLRASRGICVDRRIVGSIVVRVMLDYRTCRSSRRRARTSSRCARTRRRRPKACRAATSSSRSTAGAARRSTRRAPASGRCDDAVFERLVESRDAVLGDVDRDGEHVPRVLPERSRRHLRARLPGGHARSAT